MVHPCGYGQGIAPPLRPLRERQGPAGDVVHFAADVAAPDDDDAAAPHGRELCRALQDGRRLDRHADAAVRLVLRSEAVERVPRHNVQVRRGVQRVPPWPGVVGVARRGDRVRDPVARKMQHGGCGRAPAKAVDERHKNQLPGCAGDAARIRPLILWRRRTAIIGRRPPSPDAALVRARLDVDRQIVPRPEPRAGRGEQIDNVAHHIRVSAQRGVLVLFVFCVVPRIFRLIHRFGLRFGRRGALQIHHDALRRDVGRLSKEDPSDGDGRVGIADRVKVAPYPLGILYPGCVAIGVSQGQKEVVRPARPHRHSHANRTVHRALPDAEGAHARHAAHV